MVLRGHIDTVNTTVEAVGEGKTDGPEFTSNRNGRFRPIISVMLEVRATTACWDYSQGLAEGYV